MPPASMYSFEGKGSGMLPPGTMPPSSMKGMPPGGMKGMLPGTMPPSSMKGKGPMMTPPGTMPPGSMPNGKGQNDHRIDDGPGFGRGPIEPPKSQGLHHGFGHADSMTSEAQAALAVLKAQGIIEPDAPPLGVEKVSHMKHGRVIVGEYHPIYPSPQTAQYGMSEREVEAADVLVQEQWCSKENADMSPMPENKGTWGRANLKHICDYAMMNWKERLTTAAVWSYIHVDGWNINFWPADFATVQAADNSSGQGLNPIACIDIRQIFAVTLSRDASTIEGSMCPWEVHIIFQTGFFGFRVRTQQEADAWETRVMQGVVENVRMSNARAKFAQRLASLDDGEQNHQVKEDPARTAALAKIWHRAIQSVERGIKPSKQDFFDLYNLYDNIGGGGGDDETIGNLTMSEIETMAKELLELKVAEVKAEVVKQEKVLFSDHRPVSSSREVHLRHTIQQGRTLLAHYDRLQDPKTFFDRVVAFHHSTDISREGRVDLAEFMNSAPIFMLPNTELRHEGVFFRAAMRS